MGVRALLIALVAAATLAVRFDAPVRPGTASAAEAMAPDAAQGVIFSCPMDPDVRSHDRGKCRRCGMQLVAGVPDPIEFRVDVGSFPAALVPGKPAALQFSVRDPWKGRPVHEFNRIHEKLFHAFVVSEDLSFFMHGHPEPVADGVFQVALTLPKPGMYRVLADFYPAGAAPQLASQTIFVSGGESSSPRLARDYSSKRADNVTASFVTIPPQPIAGNRTQVRLKVDAPHGLQQYLGAWGHMLVASSDLIDMLHEHPARTDGGSEIEFEVTFPRSGVYRLWVQVQSAGVVNTMHFDVPVDATTDAPFVQQPGPLKQGTPAPVIVGPLSDASFTRSPRDVQVPANVLRPI